MKGGRAKRWRREDWLSLGLSALAEAGPAELTIEALTRRARKTTGSFYAHFASMDAFLVSLAEHWREVHTTQIIKQTIAIAPPARHLEHLTALALELDPAIEQGMRRLAGLHAGVAKICAAVDAARIAHLAAEHRRSGRLPRSLANDIARIDYAAFIGLPLIEPHATPRQLMRLYRSFLVLIGSAEGTVARKPQPAARRRRIKR